MKRLRLVSLVMFALLAFSPGLAAAYDPLQGICQNNGQSCQTCQNNAQSAICKQSTQNNENPIAGPHGVLQEATNLIAAVAGIVAVIMILISGLQFITAGGSIGGQRSGDNPSRAKKARATMASAVIGLVIVALSWAIASFIIQKFIE